MPDNITADTEVIRKLQEYMLEKLGEYVAENPTREIDILMWAHNFHRYIVNDMARRWEKNTPRHQTVRMADLTFRKAMRDIRYS